MELRLNTCSAIRTSLAEQVGKAGQQLGPRKQHRPVPSVRTTQPLRRDLDVTVCQHQQHKVPSLRVWMFPEGFWHSAWWCLGAFLLDLRPWRSFRLAWVFPCVHAAGFRKVSVLQTSQHFACLGLGAATLCQTRSIKALASRRARKNAVFETMCNMPEAPDLRNVLHEFFSGRSPARSFEFEASDN